jgi:F420-dependent methylenetetrahydromethanopterin dehydrogenase
VRSQTWNPLSLLGVISATQQQWRLSMRSFAFATILASLALASAVTPVQAKGCLKGAAVGGVAGHVAGHHSVLGATAGCAVGHHEAAKHDREQADQTQHAQGGDPSSSTPR